MVYVLLFFNAFWISLCHNRTYNVSYNFCDYSAVFTPYNIAGKIILLDQTDWSALKTESPHFLKLEM